MPRGRGPSQLLAVVEFARIAFLTGPPFFGPPAMRTWVRCSGLLHGWLTSIVTCGLTKAFADRGVVSGGHLPKR